MALVAAAIVLVLTLVATAVIAFGNGMSGGTRLSPWPVLTGGSLAALIVALSHGVHW